MFKKILILFTIFAASVFSQEPGPRITVQSLEYDFGNVQQGKKVTYNFIISNDGGSALKITNVRASCGCTAAQSDRSEIAPGDSGEIHVEFDTNGRLGKQEKYVYVFSNDKENPQLKLKITGNVLRPGETPEVNKPAHAVLYFPENEYNFGKVVQGRIVDYTFKFFNTGNSTLTIKDIRTSCGCTAALVSSKKIEPGKEGTLRVELDTSNRIGKLSRTVSIDSNDPNNPMQLLTVYANVTDEKN